MRQIPQAFIFLFGIVATWRLAGIDAKESDCGASLIQKNTLLIVPRVNTTDQVPVSVPSVLNSSRPHAAMLQFMLRLGSAEESMHEEEVKLFNKKLMKVEDSVRWQSFVFFMLFAGIVAVMSLSRSRAPSAPPGSSEDPQPTTPAGSPNNPQGLVVRWLLMLVIASLFLLCLQVALGVTSHSLTLLADSAHTATDALGYSVAYFVDRSKQGLAKHTVARIDLLSGCTCLALVVGTSSVAVVTALSRLIANSAESKVNEDLADYDVLRMGTALLIFAVVSTTVNVLLLVAHYRWVGAAQREPTGEAAISQESAQCGSTGDEGICQPCGIEHVPQAWKNKTVSKEVDVARSGKASPPQRSRDWRMLHMAFHPGCSNESCGDSTPAKEELSVEQINLNAYGALLHLWTDVLRSIIVFVAGFLLYFGFLRDPRHADAITAVIVAACVVAGSAVMLPKVRSTLKQL